MCQCPQRASTYFFKKMDEFNAKGYILCQCPQRASTYFFKYTTENVIFYGIGVNALNGLLLISSFDILYVKTNVNGVNALNGLLLISSFQYGNGSIVYYSCQCPQRASTYFFNTKGKTVYRNSVSMPSTGFYLFLRILLLFLKSKENVSMPSTGFYLFLQYPPRTLDFTEFWRGFLQVIN